MSLLLFLIVIAILLWLIPMDEPIKKIFYVVAVVLAIAWVLSMFGIIHIPDPVFVGRR